MQNKIKYRKELKRPLTSGEVDSNFEVLANAYQNLEFGIVDVAYPSSPKPTVVGQYVILESGKFINFLNSDSQPIIIEEKDFKDGNVYIVFNGVSCKKIIIPMLALGEVKNDNLGIVNGHTVYKSLNFMNFSKEVKTNNPDKILLLDKAIKGVKLFQIEEGKVILLKKVVYGFSNNTHSLDVEAVIVDSKTREYVLANEFIVKSITSFTSDITTIYLQQDYRHQIVEIDVDVGSVTRTVSSPIPKAWGLSPKP